MANGRVPPALAAIVLLLLLLILLTGRSGESKSMSMIKSKKEVTRVAGVQLLLRDVGYWTLNVAERELHPTLRASDGAAIQVIKVQSCVTSGAGTRGKNQDRGGAERAIVRICGGRTRCDPNHSPTRNNNV
jgi:hypothetical protein